MLTQKFPEYERYELGSQLRRAAMSIPLNIAEGYGKKNSEADFKRFLRMALGSNNEVGVLLDMCHDLGYIGKSTYEELSKEYDMLGRQIYSTIEKWSNSN
ncbi:four helix bundle protein, partial [Tepidiforma sp.]|uniref:four helix bundle protein n=1 Tax=Tepidiforma sp. TaxID=2682230 RepID=UPI002608F9CD